MFVFLFSSLLWAEDLDADGYDDAVDCDDTNIEVFPGAEEVCDDIDNDCNGLIDEALTITYWPDLDLDGYGDPSTPTPSCDPIEGYVYNNQDCNDSDETIYPNAEELCDELDNNCNLVIDENCGEEPSSAPTSEPTTEPAAEPATEPAAEPATEPSEEPETEPTNEPNAEPSSPNTTGRPQDLKEEGCAGSPFWMMLLLVLRRSRET
jgi:hypothetical protein